jgi:hypothetical protein
METEEELPPVGSGMILMLAGPTANGGITARICEMPSKRNQRANNGSETCVSCMGMRV